MPISEISTATTPVWGWIGGGGLATVAIAALQLRKWLSRDSLLRHRDSAEKDILERLSDELEKSHKRVEIAEKRSDEAYEERNNMLRELMPIHGTMAAMEERLKQQAETILLQNEELAKLRHKVRQQGRPGAV
ncbi:hypothetical protein [Paraburkholderia sp. MM6662-R1]|uniref:hypothetical protein n=1 Tax=Paraburkholderia sp. MM6662-R1 TaxID=2991066 RepID=UPI003D217304